MVSGLDSSWHKAFAEGEASKRVSRSFKNLRQGRLVGVIFAMVIACTALMIGLLTMFPHMNKIAFVVIFSIFILVGIAILYFLIMPTWCSLNETITFEEDGFESKLYGKLCCKDITSYALSTFSGSDKSIKIVTENAIIRYNLGPGEGDTHAWLSLRIKTMVDDFNARAVLARGDEKTNVDSHGLDTGAVHTSSSIPNEGLPIKDTSFFKSEGAIVLVVVGFVVLLLLLAIPSGGVQKYGMIAMLGGALMSITGMIISSRRK